MWPNYSIRRNHSNNCGNGVVKNFHRGVLTHVEARNLLACEFGLPLTTIIKLIGPAIESVPDWAL